jgi:Cu2+-containing amine oxidase
MAPTTTGKSSFVDQMLSLIKPQSHLAVLPAPGLHPLDPLTAGEITAAGKACREHAQKLSLKSIRFNAITLQVQPFRTCLHVLKQISHSFALRWH